MPHASRGKLTLVLPLLLLASCSQAGAPALRGATVPAADSPSIGTPMKDTVSPDPQAPSVVVYGKTAGRMDEVIRLLRDMGGVSAYGAFTEAEALQRIATVPRLRAVLMGGAVEEASRRRIRDELARNHPGVPTSEPGQQYPYSDENIVADVRAKLRGPGK